MSNGANSTGLRKGRSTAEQALMYLKNSPGVWRPVDALAKQLCIRSSINGMLTVMERKGLIEMQRKRNGGLVRYDGPDFRKSTKDVRFAL